MSPADKGDQVPPSVAWDNNVDPPIPLVTELVMAGDGHMSILVHDRNESLRRLWAFIEATTDGGSAS